MHILDREVPGLSERLRALSLENRRRILASACQLAAETIIELEPPVRDLLDTISSNNTLSETQVAEARLLAETADEQYFRLSGENKPDKEWLEWFCKGRLLTAIATGFSGDSWSDAADAVYELSKSRNDPVEIIAMVESGIDAIRETDAEG